MLWNIQNYFRRDYSNDFADDEDDDDDYDYEEDDVLRFDGVEHRQQIVIPVMAYRVEDDNNY